MNIVLTVFSLTITVVVYQFSRKLARKYVSPFTSPVILSTVLLIVILLSLRISYDSYSPAKEMITFLLGPATVALAVPIFKQRHLLKKYAVPIVIGITVGSIVTIISALLLAHFLQFSNIMLASLSLKSITIPVAAEVAPLIAADEFLVAAFVMITGMLGAFIGPWLLNLFRITNPLSRGLSMGTIAHGIGTAEILKEGELPGAVSAVAMGLTAMTGAIAIPYFFEFFPFF